MPSSNHLIVLLLKQAFEHSLTFNLRTEDRILWGQQDYTRVKAADIRNSIRESALQVE